MTRCLAAAAWCGVAAVPPAAPARAEDPVAIHAEGEAAAVVGDGAAVQVQVQAVPAAPAGGAAAEPRKLEPLPPVPQLLDSVMRGFLEGVPGKDTLDDVMRRAANRNQGAAAAEAAQRAQFMRQQAQQFDTMLQPLLAAELAMVRRTCGSLTPEARREVLVAARQGVREVALQVAKVQFEGDAGRPPSDVRLAIHERVANAVERSAAAAEFASYESESRRRRERREEAARIRIVLKLDERLGLTAAQRTAVLTDLRARWQAAWIRELEDHGVNVNDQPLAPDFAEDCIAPHLDAAQSRSWRQWCETAGAKAVPMSGIDWSEFNTLQQHPQKIDDWWRP